MTEFENQVRAALMFASHQGTMRPVAWADAISFIAPSVAAAIAAGGRVVADGTIVAQANWEAALAAIRGAP